MKRCVVALAISLSTLGFGQSLNTAQQGTILNHVDEVAGEIGLISILCPASTLLPGDLLMCFQGRSTTFDLFRAQWDLHVDWKETVTHTANGVRPWRSEEHTSELQSRGHLV